MTKKEFETQKALGLLPLNSELRFCTKCLNHTPHMSYTEFDEYYNYDPFIVYKCLNCLK